MSVVLGEQLELEDYLQNFTKNESYKISTPIRFISCFSGIGCQISALKRLDYPYEDYKTSEWDAQAVKIYNAMHFQDYKNYAQDKNLDELIEFLYKKGVSLDGKTPLSYEKIKRKGLKWITETYNNFIATHNIGSIINVHAEDLEIVEKDKYTYILVYSYPCQAISFAGKQEGYEKGSGTSSSLLWEIGRILEECKEKDCLPQILLAENVAACHSKKFLVQFNSWLDTLDQLGYKTFWTDMNAKDYGVPQSRNRTFILSILNKNAQYTFPEPMPLTTCMKDFLEDEVDEKFYLNTPKAKALIEKLLERGGLKDLPINSPLGNLTPADNEKIHQRNWVYNENGICPCITSTSYKDPARVMMEKGQTT